jgi:hypothetical protein
MDSSRMDPDQDNGSMDFTACIGGIASNSQPDKTINFQYDAEDDGEMELTGCHTTTIRQGDTGAQHPHSSASEHKSGGSLFSFADRESKVDSSKFLSKIGMNKPVQLPDFLASDSPIQFPRRASVATSGGQERQATEQMHRHSLGSNLKSTTASGPLSFLQRSTDESNETQSQKVDVHSFLNKLGSAKKTEVPDFLRSPAQEKTSVPTFTRSSEQEKVDVNSFLHKLGAGERVSVPAFLLSESPVSHSKLQDAKNCDGNMERNKPSTSSNEDEGNRTRLFSENDMEFTEVIGNMTKSQSDVSGNSPAKTEGADLNEHTHIFTSGEIGEDMDLTGTGTVNIQPKQQEDRRVSQASTQKSKHQDQSFTQKDLFRLIMNRKSSMINAKAADRAEMESTKSEAGHVMPDDKTMVFSSHDGEMEMTTCMTETKSVEKNKASEGDYLDSRNQTKVFSNDEDGMDMTSCLAENKSFASSKRKSMDQTKLFSGNDGSMEMTTCLESKKYSNDEETGTTCVEEKKVMDKTRMFSTHDGSMEITCVEEQEAVDKTRVFSTHEGEMEITTCIDEKTTTDKTTIFSEHHGRMEMTCLEEKEIVDKTRLFSGHDGHMEMTACLDKTKTVDKTTIFSSNNDGMEMTCLEEREVTCKAETYMEDDDENTDETDAEKATTLSTSPSKEAEVTTSAQENPESLDQSCAEMNAMTRIRARLAQLAQKLNSTSTDRTESITSENASTTMREDTLPSDPCKTQDSALKRIASFPSEQGTCTAFLFLCFWHFIFEDDNTVSILHKLSGICNIMP